MDDNKITNASRRKFLGTLGMTFGISTISNHWTYGGSSVTKSSAGMTIQQVIDLILTKIPGAPFSETVDTIKSGDGQQEVKGIVTTMFATIDVINKAAALGANFIIAHEPTFYNHRDDTA